MAATKLDVFLEEGAIRGNYSPKILKQRLESNEWLVLGRLTIADVSVLPPTSMDMEIADDFS